MDEKRIVADFRNVGAVVVVVAMVVGCDVGAVGD